MAASSSTSWRTATLNEEQLAAALSDPKLQLGMLFSALLSLPVVIAVWWAPALVVFQDASATAALLASLRAATANWRALVMYALGVFFYGGVLPALTSTPSSRSSCRRPRRRWRSSCCFLIHDAWGEALNATLRDTRTQLAMLFAVAVALPTLAALWFAPGLVVFQDLSAPAALGHSLRAAFANWRPLVVYALAVFALGGALPAIVLGLLAVVLPQSAVAVIAFAFLLPYALFFAATLHVSDYVSYRDVFHANETLAPLSHGG